MQRYIVVNKAVGQTPLHCLEALRQERPGLRDTPLTYAGRLDPMASGKLLILIGEECKQQNNYHGLDKEYEFSVLLGCTSDTGDVLGLVIESTKTAAHESRWQHITQSLVGDITLPYPHFSSRAVQGKPLHTWAVEGRISEITIPEKHSRIYHLSYVGERIIRRDALVTEALTKIALLPPVTDPRQALGNDFRRPQVRAYWNEIATAGAPDDTFTIITFRCIASSGTYMRSLAEVLARRVGTGGLAYHIHRTVIGRYIPLWRGSGFWRRRFV